MATTPTSGTPQSSSSMCTPAGAGTPTNPAAAAPPTSFRPNATMSLFGATRSSGSTEAGTPTTPAAAAAPASSSRPNVTMSLFGATRSSGSTAVPGDQQESSLPINEPNDSSDQTWTLSFTCEGAPGGQESSTITISRAELTLSNLILMKLQLGFRVRDYLYYKRRCGNAATLHELEEEVHADAMIACNEEERQVRLLLSKDQKRNQNVNITPLKIPVRRTIREENIDEDEESIDAYKEWLDDMHKENRFTDLKDMDRDDTTKTYKEWLRVQGQLDDIMAYVDSNHHTDVVLSSEDSNPTPPVNRPSHARRFIPQGEGTNSKKRKPRGNLKGWTATKKRTREASQKLSIQFSRLGGPVGSNKRIFVDEITLFTRKRAPLIGVRTWRDIHVNVKIAIANDVLAKWDLEDNEANRVKIWTVANDRYKGWRSTFSATYKAYTTYEERMRHRPEELDIVEWHYLVLYFGTEGFQRISNKNSENRLNRKINHVTGSKGFSQVSYEKRDQLTGEEPNDMELFMMTHQQNGQWTSEESREVYDNANRKIMELESRPDANGVSDVEQNQIFQSTYKETRKIKSNKMHANGYLARYPTRKELLSEDYQRKLQQEDALIESFRQLQDRLEAQDAEREAERQEHRRQLEQINKEREADREALRQATLMLQAAQQQASVQQASTIVEPTENVVAAATIEGTQNVTTTEGEHMMHSQQVTQENSQPEQQPPSSAADQERLTRGRTTRSNSAAQNKGANSGAVYTTTKQLKENAARKRSALSKKNTQEES